MKTGRNDICPCGSGKKYKKCCLIKDEKAVVEQQVKAHAEFEEWFKADIVAGQKALQDTSDYLNPDEFPNIDVSIPVVSK